MMFSSGARLGVYEILAPLGKGGMGRVGARFGTASAPEHSGEFSPDGRWIAYVSEESGAGGGKWQVSTDGGVLPRWARSGRELFFRGRGRIMAVTVEPGATFQAATPKVLFQQVSEFTAYDVSPDAKRFLMVHSGVDPESTAAPQAHIVLEWFEDIRRRVW